MGGLGGLEFYLVKSLSALILPPGGNLMVGFLGALLWRRFRALGTVIMLLAGISLYLLSTTMVAGGLRSTAAGYPALAPEEVPAGAEAIVVLSGGRHRDPVEYGFDTVAADTLERVRYAAFLARRTGLPILVSGGRLNHEHKSLGALMRDTLENDYGLAARWVEGRSLNTAENAALSTALLAQDGIRHILLVTHGLHMRRAVSAFSGRGLAVTPAPTVKGGRPRRSLLSWLPSPSALLVSHAALHELLGRVWYWMRYRDR